MAFATGRYGVEYDPERREDGTSPALRWLVAAVIVAAAASLAVTAVKRVRSGRDDDGRAGAPAAEPGQPRAAAPAPVAPPAPPAPVTPAAPAPAAPAPASASAEASVPVRAVRPAASVPGDAVLPSSDLDRRPPKVRGLLMKLDAAEAAQDVAMAVSTIELIRAQPGQPAADIDDRLARRLGELNVRWLFELKNAQWVRDVRVKPGDSATRIARENASTLASLRRLNPSLDVERLRAGQTIKVMNQPRFNLIVHKRMLTADLQLNGKFFKRYDLAAGVAGGPGAFESSGNLRQLLAEKGVRFAAADRTELETLMPRGSSLTISEM